MEPGTDRSYSPVTWADVAGVLSDVAWKRGWRGLRAGACCAAHSQAAGLSLFAACVVFSRTWGLRAGWSSFLFLLLRWLATDLGTGTASAALVLCRPPPLLLAERFIKCCCWVPSSEQFAKCCISGSHFLSWALPEFFRCCCLFNSVSTFFFWAAAAAAAARLVSTLPSPEFICILLLLPLSLFH